MPIRHIALAVLVAFIYGVSFVAIRLAVDEVPPLMATGWRFLLTAIPLIAFIGPPKVHWLWPAAFGVVQGALMFGTLFTAMSWGMPGGLASLVAQLQVFFTIGLSALIFAERPAAHHQAGALIAFAGMVLTGWSKVTEAAPLLPFLMVVLAAGWWGVANTIAKAARPPDMLAFIIWGSLAAPLPLFAASMALEGTQFGWPGAMPSMKAVGAILFMAWGATVFAFTAWNWLLRQHPSAVVTPFALLIPVFGFSSMALAFGERVGMMTLAGAAVVFCGLALTIFGSRLAPLFTRAKGNA